MWNDVKEMLNYRNQDLQCQDGDPKAFDFDKMRSYCFYKGNCMSMGLESLFVQLPSGDTFEIVKE